MGTRATFIVSTGRAGSKMLARTMALHPQLFAIHEPRPHLNPEAFAKWSGLHPDTVIKKSVRNKRDFLIDEVKNNKLMYLESSHYCSHLIPILNELYDARFIYLYRDGRDFVRSGLERSWYKEKTCFWYNPIISLKKHFLNYLSREKFMIDRSWDDHRLTPPNELTTRLEKVAWLWVEINSIILKSFDTYNLDFISIKLEDFGPSAIKKILDFNGLNSSDSLVTEMVRVSKKRPNKTKERKVDKFKNWDDSDKKKFFNITSEMMDTLAYKY